MSCSKLTLERLLKDGSEGFRRRNAAAADRAAWASCAKQKPNEQAALVGPRKDKKGVVEIAGSLHIRIVRKIPDKRHNQDDDNFQGGAKELRDSIAEFLSRQGDSEEDGLTWEYVTEYGQFAVEIEIFRKENDDA